MRQQIHLRHRSIFSSLKNILIFFLIFSATPAHAQMEVLKDMYERAVTAYSKQQYDQAIELYQQILKVVPNFAPAYNGMALSNQAAGGDENKTIEYLKTAISYDPKLVQAYDNLGRIYYGREDVDHAEEYFKKALDIDPSLTTAQLSLAWINLLARSRPTLAVKYFKMVLTVSQDPKIYYGLGQAYFASNQREEVMDVITKLYGMGEEELASRLEKSLREDKQVDTDAPTDSGMSNPAVTPAALGPIEPTPDKPTGMQARLRGKLSDY